MSSLRIHEPIFVEDRPLARLKPPERSRTPSPRRLLKSTWNRRSPLVQLILAFMSGECVPIVDHRTRMSAPQRYEGLWQASPTSCFWCKVSPLESRLVLSPKRCHSRTTARCPVVSSDRLMSITAVCGSSRWSEQSLHKCRSNGGMAPDLGLEPFSHKHLLRPLEDLMQST